MFELAWEYFFKSIFWETKRSEAKLERDQKKNRCDVSLRQIKANQLAV